MILKSLIKYINHDYRLLATTFDTTRDITRHRVYLRALTRGVDTNYRPVRSLLVELKVIPLRFRRIK